MPNGVPVLVLAEAPVVAADGWGRLAVYKMIGGASVLMCPFPSTTVGGLDGMYFSLIGERNDGRLNTGDDTESTTDGCAVWEVDGIAGSSGGPVDYSINGS